uniref:Uncharacterized protein n=1 Tax=Cucumis sativus TaxID=3659 RepID=A0A0A0K8I1_CUCSA
MSRDSRTMKTSIRFRIIVMPNPTNSLACHMKCKTGVQKTARRLIMFFLSNQTQKKMLGKNQILRKGFRLSLRKYHSLNRSFREPLKNGRNDRNPQPPPLLLDSTADETISGRNKRRGKQGYKIGRWESIDSPSRQMGIR